MDLPTPSPRKLHLEKLAQGTQEIWDTMKSPNLRIIGIKEWEDSQVKGTKSIFNKIIEEGLSSLKKEMPIMVQEAQRTPDRLDQKRESLQHMTVKTRKEQDREQSELQGRNKKECIKADS